MNPLLDQPAMKLYAMSAAIVALHMFLLAGITGGVRASRKVFVNPEDAALNKATQANDDHPDVLRVMRAHNNLIESAVPFFAVGLLYALTNPSAGTAKAYFFTFVGARALHSVFYLLGKQPFRTISFAVGAFAVIGMAVHVLRAF